MRAGLDAQEKEVVVACACGKGFLPALADLNKIRKSYEIESYIH
jgi:hypothetical protein